MASKLKGKGGNFVIDITKAVARQKATAREIILKIVFDMFARVVQRNPVDTGRMRANWQVNVGSPITSQVDETDKSGGGTKRREAEKINNWSGDGSIFITNNVEYAGIIEYGKDDGTPGSQQAPEGVVRITVLEMANFLKKAKLADLKQKTNGSL